MNVDRINEHYYGDLTDPQTERTRQRIHWICGQVAGQDVLDIGCSQGIVCLILGREGFRCTGIDIEKASLEIARQALSKEDEIVQRRVTFQAADASQLPFADESFDTVVLGEVLEHLTHPAKVLGEAKRVLRDGGHVIVTVPLGLNAFHDHKHSYYPISLLELLQPLFRTHIIDTMTNYITYAGVSDSIYDPSSLSKESLFLEYLRLEKAVEARCLEKEHALLETGTRLYEKINTLASRSKAQASRIKELQELVATEVRKSNELKVRINELKEVVASRDEEIRELVAKNASWPQRVADVETLYKDRLHNREQELRDLMARQVANQRVRELVRAALPVGARVIVVSKGDDDLLQLDGRFGWHFPQAAGGAYAGYHPKDSAEAIGHLETLKTQGGEFLLIPASSFWWLDHYAEFRQHLEANYRVAVYEEDSCIVYELRASVAEHSRRFTMSLNSRPAPGNSFPSAAQQEKAAARKAAGVVGLGVVLDEFTMGCFQPECELVTFRPDNWKDALERECPDAIFVESAWRGNDGGWLYRVASYARNMGNELADMLDWAQQRNIPAIFWNKEDPVHFERFIERARLFSHVFTTDADCIPRYREQIGHDRVYALPFAAQPVIHNPVQDQPRDGQVCFAGTYYGSRHEERQTDMDYILRPAIPFGLDIYDRQHGMTGKTAEQYRFPDIYQACIKGRLDYDEMVKAYKRYRVFLNVNSVKQSPTMFSRRVFELLACGTPVISTYSRGIVELLGEDIVFFTESDADTRGHLECLLGNDDAWARASVRGIRKVMREHTYGHRLREVFESVGLTLPAPREPEISVIVQIGSESELECLVPMLRAQTYTRFDLVLVSQAPLSSDALQRLRDALPELAVASAVGEPDEVYEQCQQASAAKYLAFFDVRDAYGADYLLDHALATMYCDADFLGKHTYCGHNSTGEQQLKEPGHEFHYVASVPSATLVARKTALSKSLFEQALSGRSFLVDERQILSIDRFNYLQDALSGDGPGRGRAEEAVKRMEVYV